MKYMFLLLAAIICSMVSSAQTKGTAKIYGYIQEVLPGANNTVIEEGGEVSVQKNIRRNYKIYIQSASRVYPVEMWIDGEPYSVKMDVITTTPVVHGSEAGGNRKELVPKTTGKVLQLTPSTYVETKNAGDVRSIAEKNALVVLYKQNGKFYYNSLDKLELLEAAAMQ